MQAVLRGEVPVRIEAATAASGKSAGRGLGAIIVERPVQQVWATITHFEDKPEYMPRLKSITVLAKGPERMRVRTVVSVPLSTMHYTSWYSLDAQAHILSWKMDKTAPDNTIADTEGEYRLSELGPARTLMVYTSYVDAGRSVPRFIQDYISRRSIPDLLRAVKARVEHRNGDGGQGN